MSDPYAPGPNQTASRDDESRRRGGLYQATSSLPKGRSSFVDVSALLRDVEGTLRDDPLVGTGPQRQQRSQRQQPHGLAPLAGAYVASSSLYNDEGAPSLHGPQYHERGSSHHQHHQPPGTGIVDSPRHASTDRREPFATTQYADQYGSGSTTSSTEPVARAPAPPFRARNHAHHHRASISAEMDSQSGGVGRRTDSTTRRRARAPGASATRPESLHHDATSSAASSPFVEAPDIGLCAPTCGLGSRPSGPTQTHDQPKPGLATNPSSNTSTPTRSRGCGGVRRKHSLNSDATPAGLTSAQSSVNTARNASGTTAPPTPGTSPQPSAVLMLAEGTSNGSGVAAHVLGTQPTTPAVVDVIELPRLPIPTVPSTAPPPPERGSSDPTHQPSTAAGVLVNGGGRSSSGSSASPLPPSSVGKAAYSSTENLHGQQSYWSNDLGGSTTNAPPPITSVTSFSRYSATTATTEDPTADSTPLKRGSVDIRRRMLVAMQEHVARPVPTRPGASFDDEANNGTGQSLEAATEEEEKGVGRRENQIGFAAGPLVVSPPAAATPAVGSPGAGDETSSSKARWSPQPRELGLTFCRPLVEEDEEFFNVTVDTAAAAMDAAKLVASGAGSVADKPLEITVLRPEVRILQKRRSDNVTRRRAMALNATALPLQKEPRHGGGTGGLSRHRVAVAVAIGGVLLAVALTVAIVLVLIL